MLKTLDSVAQTLCLPSDHNPVRYPTYPSIDKTALFEYRFQNTISLKGTQPATPSNTHGRRRFVLTRDPAAPVLVDTDFLPSPISSPVTGNAMIAVTETINTDSSPGTGSDFSIDFNRIGPYDSANTLSRRHIFGVYDSKHWWVVPWCLDATGVAYTPVNRVGVRARAQDGTVYTAGNYEIQIEWVDSSGVLRSLTTENTQIEYKTIVDPILVRVTSLTAHTGFPAGPFNCELFLLVPSADTVVRSLGHVYDNGVNPEYFNAVAPFESSRLNATSMLLTNVTKVLNKEGTVLATRVLTSFDNGGSPMRADIPMISATNPDTRYFGALEKGSYCYTAPDQESLSFKSSIIGDGSNEAGNLGEKPYAILDLSPRYYNVVLLSDPDSTEDTQIAMSVDQHWEFRTMSTLFLLDYSRMPLEVYHAAMLAVLKAGLFFENINHKQILSLVGRGIKFASPLVASAVGGPPAAMMAKLATAAVSSAVKHVKQGKANKRPKPDKKGKGSMKQASLK